MLDVGRVVRPHGLRGVVVVELWTNRPERMSGGARLTTGGRVLVVEKATAQTAVGGSGRWLVTFSGVSTHEEAEALRDAVLQAEPLDVDGALWVHEMVGADLFDVSGSLVGNVVAVEANPASDLLVLDDGRLVPLTFVTAGSEGRLIVDGPPGLLDLLER